MTTKPRGGRKPAARLDFDSDDHGPHATPEHAKRAFKSAKDLHDKVRPWGRKKAEAYVRKYPPAPETIIGLLYAVKSIDASAERTTYRGAPSRIGRLRDAVKAGARTARDVRERHRELWDEYPNIELLRRDLRRIKKAIS